MLCLGLTGGVAGPATPAFAEGPSAEAVQRFIDAYRSRHGLPGIAVAVVKDGVPVLEAASGSGAEPITAGTPTALASVTKVITTFAVLQLVDDAMLELDDPVIDHLPEFVLDDTRGASITVRQLLAHTSGLPNPMIVPPAESPQQRMPQLQDIELVNDPGTSYLYSNLGYHTAARLIEVVSGQPYADYLEEHLFAPLGMHDTFATLDRSDDTGRISGHVTAYGGAIPLREMTAMNVGSGNVISTAQDMSLCRRLRLVARRDDPAVGPGAQRLVADHHPNRPACQTAVPVSPNPRFGQVPAVHRPEDSDPKRLGTLPLRVLT